MTRNERYLHILNVVGKRVRGANVQEHCDSSGQLYCSRLELNVDDVVGPAGTSILQHGPSLYPEVKCSNVADVS
jgi:hypothetical protein